MLSQCKYCIDTCLSNTRDRLLIYNISMNLLKQNNSSNCRSSLQKRTIRSKCLLDVMCTTTTSCYPLSQPMSTLLLPRAFYLRFCRIFESSALDSVPLSISVNGYAMSCALVLRVRDQQPQQYREFLHLLTFL